MHGTTLLPISIFFPLPRKIWSELIGVCIMRRLRWAERGRVIPRTEGQAFWGSWLSTPALWCMYSCVPVTTLPNPRFFLGIGCIKRIQSDCINIFAYAHECFSKQKSKIELLGELRISHFSKVKIKKKEYDNINRLNFYMETIIQT